MEERDDEYSIFFKRLASAIILRALNDLKGKKDTYRYITAYNFCFGIDDVWLDSLKLWSDLAETTPEKITNKAMEIVNGKSTNAL